MQYPSSFISWKFISAYDWVNDLPRPFEPPVIKTSFIWVFLSPTNDCPVSWYHHQLKKVENVKSMGIVCEIARFYLASCLLWIDFSISRTDYKCSVSETGFRKKTIWPLHKFDILSRTIGDRPRFLSYLIRIRILL